MLRFRIADHLDDYKTIELLADEIWREHYTPIIGKAQVDYMLDNFQTVEAISKQIDEGAVYYLLEFESIAVGYLCYYLKEDHLFLSKIYVHQNMRGKGLGKSTIDFLLKKTINVGLSKISLTVNKNNHKTIEAYKKMGFQIVKPIVMDIGGGFVMDDYLMEKTI